MKTRTLRIAALCLAFVLLAAGLVRTLLHPVTEIYYENRPANRIGALTGAALLDGTAVCQGYATLMYRMLLEVGVDCRVVTGYVDGEGHAWNIVKLGDLYYNIDATFDDGEGMDPRECFLKNAAHFADHERDPEFLTEAFLLPRLLFLFAFERLSAFLFLFFASERFLALAFFPFSS